MKPASVRYSALALRRQNEAYDWYKERSADTAERFLVALRAATAQLASYPWAGRLKRPPIRQKRVLDFPYALLYEVRQHDILVLTVAHMRQHPKRWMK